LLEQLVQEPDGYVVPRGWLEQAEQPPVLQGGVELMLVVLESQATKGCELPKINCVVGLFCRCGVSAFLPQGFHRIPRSTIPSPPRLRSAAPGTSRSATTTRPS